MFFQLKKIYAQHHRLIWAGAVFLSSFVLYALSAPHTIFTNDNPEFVTAAATAGIPHPSGYPLYVILAWFAAKLPFGSVAYRVNIFSSLCAAGALAAGYLIIGKIVRSIEPENPFPDWLAAALVLPLAATDIFWFQAIVGKTYALNLLLTLVAILLAVKCREKRRPRDFYAFALVAGLGISDHPMFALSLPFLAAMLILKKSWNKKVFLIGGALFLLGLAPYAYIPIRSAMRPMLDWSRANDWPSFWRFITRAQYQDLGAGGLGDKLAFLSSFSANVWDQFGWLLLFFPLGIVWVFKFSKRWCYALAAALIPNFFGIIALRNSEFSYANAAFNAPYYLPSYFVIFLFSVFGAWYCLRFCGKFAALIVVLLCLLGSAFLFQKNVSTDDLHAFRFIDDLSRQTLASLPKDSVYIENYGNAAGDTISFAIMYQQFASRVRPDVTVIDLYRALVNDKTGLAMKAYSTNDVNARRAALLAYARFAYPGRPVYASFPLFFNGAPVVTPYAYGLSGATPSALPPMVVSGRDRAVLKDDIFGGQALSDHDYLEAAYFLEMNDRASSQTALDRALGESPMPGGQEFVDFTKLRQALKAK